MGNSFGTQLYRVIPFSDIDIVTEDGVSARVFLLVMWFIIPFIRNFPELLNLPSYEYYNYWCPEPIHIKVLVSTTSVTVFYSANFGDTAEMIVFEFRIITGTTHLAYKLVRIVWPDPDAPDDPNEIYTSAKLSS